MIETDQLRAVLSHPASREALVTALREKMAPLGWEGVNLTALVDQYQERNRMTETTKLAQRLDKIRDAVADAWIASQEQTLSILADTERAMKRAMRRAETLADEWERVEFVQSRGPTVEMTARLLIEDEYESKGRDPIKAHMQIWETKGGALVAIDETQRLDGVSTPRLAVAVCPPTGDDAQEQRFAVMEHFGWSSRARSMARKLGWSLRTEVA